jgi:hypothetical protein
VVTATLPVPDEVHETYLEVRDPASGDVISAVEALSPTNKRPGEGERAHRERRLRTLGTRTHSIELDLLRGGEPPARHLTSWPVDVPQTGAYRVVVARGDRRPRADVYLAGIREPLPSFPLPLRPGDEEPVVELNRLVHALYDRGGYALRLDYRLEPVPPLDPGDTAWAGALHAQRGLR